MQGSGIDAKIGTWPEFAGQSRVIDGAVVFEHCQGSDEAAAVSIQLLIVGQARLAGRPGHCPGQAKASTIQSGVFRAFAASKS